MEATTRPIPERLNLILAMLIVSTAVGLLWLGSQLSLLGMIAMGVVFSHLLLCNYALMHEASHDMLHGDRRINWLAGMVLGWLFPTSFTVMQVTHIVHHCCNRTDHELFDYYYAGDFLPFKYVQWYGLLLGLWWPFIPLGSLLLGVAPGLLRSGQFRKARCTSVLFDDFGSNEIRRIRVELLLGMLFWALLLIIMGITWDAVLIMYVCFAFNWSTRQYVTHAFTPRNVRDGALNLTVSRPMGWVLLNGQWDLVHHQRPHLPWVYLPEEGKKSQPPVSYLQQYLKLWKGPRPNPESAPAVLPKGAYQSM